MWRIAVVLALGGCGGKDDTETAPPACPGAVGCDTPPTDTGTTTPTGGDTTTLPPFECDVVGFWEVDAVWCGLFEITDDWMLQYSLTRMNVRNDCTAEVTTAGASCIETEIWRITNGSLTEIEIARDGIDSCFPDACLFDPYDDPCALGEHTAEPDQYFVQRFPLDGEIRITGFLTERWPDCTDDLLIEFRLQ